MLPRDTDAPAFAEPWHAQLFAITHTLAAAGHIEWSQWSDRFASALDEADRAGAPRDGSAHYDVWLAALVEFLYARGLAGSGELDDLEKAWAAAYLSTPHGEPVEIGEPLTDP